MKNFQIGPCGVTPAPAPRWGYLPGGGVNDSQLQMRMILICIYSKPEGNQRVADSLSAQWSI